MMTPGTDKRVYSVSIHSGAVFNGITPDGRSVVQKGREESTQYQTMFGIRIPGHVLADRLAMKFQMSTIYSAYRPYGTSVIISHWDAMKGFQLYMIEPSGSCY